MPSPLTSAPLVLELTRKLGLPTQAIIITIETWNLFITLGSPKDPLTKRVQFHPNCRSINVEPFYSKPIMVGVNLTCGSFVTTLLMQVVDV